MKIRFTFLLLVFQTSLTLSSPTTASPLASSRVWVDEEYERYKKRGDEFFAQGDYEKARKQYENCLEVPGFANDAYAKKRIDVCNQALSLRQRAAEALRQGKGADAADLYTQILTLNAADPTTKATLADYWTNEGNTFYDQKQYAQAKASYEKALNYTTNQQLLKIQIANIERDLRQQGNKPTPPVAAPTQPVSGEPATSLQKTTGITERTVRYRKPLTGWKIAAGAVALGAGYQAFSLRNQINGKISDLNALSRQVDPDGDNIIQTPDQYDRWQKAYQEAEQAKARQSTVTVYLGVAAVAVLGEIFLLTRKTKRKNSQVFWRPSGMGVGVSYTFR